MDFRDLFVVLASFSVAAHAGDERGYMQVKVTASNDLLLTTCATYEILTTHFPQGVANVTEKDWHNVIDIHSQTGCPALSNLNANGKYVFIGVEQCGSSYVKRLFAVSKAYGLVFVSDTLNISSQKLNNAAVISKNSYGKFVSLKESYNEQNLSVSIYKPAPVELGDVPVANLIVIWLLALSAVAYGAWWRGYESRELIVNPTPASRSNQRRKKLTTWKDWCMCCAVIFYYLFIMGLVLGNILFLYYFYDQYVYVIIVWFCIATSVTLFLFLYFFAKRFSCMEAYKVPANNIPFLKKQPSIGGICLYFVCTIVPIMWAVYRKAWFSWILQDILGFTLCVVGIKGLTIGSYKSSTIILIFWFLYDIFFVFITPSITNTKKSIMEQAATGRDDSMDDASGLIVPECEEDYSTSTMSRQKEIAPIIFLIPYINDVLKNGFSILGFGDVIIPGLHLGFCAAWDVLRSERRLGKAPIYFLAALAGYGFGLMLTFVAMSAMKTAQPALLYLVPCCLLSTVIVGWRKKELKALWAGKYSTETAAFAPLQGENENASNDVPDVFEQETRHISVKNTGNYV